ncbi:MAG: GNAT family N-acetyltransferase [Lachnospiraceae bacterium]|nr:GNAT family N-acetyltransferase [Lachnospiraceae bacterium]
MIARKLTREDLPDANRISAFAFHARLEDPEKLNVIPEDDPSEQWGAFSEDGVMAARIINNRFEGYLDGNPVKNGGIGSVSTLPEYREQGAVRAVFEKLLPEAYRQGEVISTLYPFNHAFYRKFGYETVCVRNIYHFSPAVLRNYRFSGTAHPYREGDPVSDYFALYREFAANYNFMLERDEKRMADRLKSVPLRDRRFAYLLSEGDVPKAYLIFQDIRHDPAAILKVQELAWKDRAGFEMILGFLGRFTADYGEIQLPLPVGVELHSVLRSSLAYDVTKETRQDFMVRIINAEKLLSAIRLPDCCSFVIQVTDEMIPENNGCFRVKSRTGEENLSGNTVERCEDQPDLAVSERALGQLATGAVSLREALLRPDTVLTAKEELLSRVFVRKDLFIEDHF